MRWKVPTVKRTRQRIELLLAFTSHRIILCQQTESQIAGDQTPIAIAIYREGAARCYVVGCRLALLLLLLLLKLEIADAPLAALFVLDDSK